jgi:hypothetical protein
MGDFAAAVKVRAAGRTAIPAKFDAACRVG